jgi:hypothetical protein
LEQVEALQQVVLILSFQLLLLTVVDAVQYQKISPELVEEVEAVVPVIQGAAAPVILHQQAHHKAIMVVLLQVKELLFILTTVEVEAVLQQPVQTLQIQVLLLLVPVAKAVMV